MSQRMRVMQPKLTSDTEAVVTAENNDVGNSLTAMMPSILRFMRQDLQNTALTITVRVPEHIEETHTHDRREQLRHLCDVNPALVKLGKAFNLELL